MPKLWHFRIAWKRRRELTAPVSEERAKEVSAIVDRVGKENAAKVCGLSVPTISRYVRHHKMVRRGADEPSLDDRVLRRVRERFSDAELRNLLNGADTNTDTSKAVHDFVGDELTIGIITDTHIGSRYTDPRHLEEAFETFASVGADLILHAGDVHEGLSNRPGHMYECTALGYSAQLEESRKVFGQWTDSPIYMVDGNHDRWFIKSNGAKIVEELCAGQSNLHFLGHDEGDIDIGGATIKLWHGEDGSSYAFSYRIQKIVESFTGGEKPHILVAGHTHKALYMFDRHVHCISAGSMQKQSKWMRGKRHASHTGFYVVRLAVNDSGVAWFEPRFYPFYV